MKIIVDKTAPEIKSSLPLPAIEKISSQIIDVGNEVLKNQVYKKRLMI